MQVRREISIINAREGEGRSLHKILLIFPALGTEESDKNEALKSLTDLQLAEKAKAINTTKKQACKSALKADNESQKDGAGIVCCMLPLSRSANWQVH